MHAMKTSHILLLILLCLAGCKKASDEVTISGEIKGLGTDTLYLYGMDESFDRIDTIYAHDDKFAHRIKADTIISALLLIGNRTEYPIYFDKGNRISIEGDTAHLHCLTVKGSIYNEEFSRFQQELYGGQEAPMQAAAEAKAEEFIRQHTSSYVSLYLLDKYFVQKETLDLKKIKELKELLTGVLQDKLYMERLTESVTRAEKMEVGKYAPFFTLSNAEGEKISRSSEMFKEKNLLLCFWASWCDSTVNRRNTQELKALYREYKKNKYLGMLGVSFDMEKQHWTDAIGRDTLEWEQVRSSEGLNSDLAHQYSIHRLPYNILLSPEGKIIAKDLKGDELREQVAKAVAQSEQKEKEKKEREKQRKSRK